MSHGSLAMARATRPPTPGLRRDLAGAQSAEAAPPPAADEAYAPLGRGDVILRTATVDEAAEIHSLIVEQLAEGHLLPRQLEEIVIHAHRFVVAVQHGQVIACAELAPLSREVAEVRSLVVGRDARTGGLGRQILDELVRRATLEGFEKLCAFTHAPAYFVRLGFSIVPHVWVPEKIVTDCRSCVHFRRCGQYAVVRALGRGRQACVPLAALHG